MSAIFAQRLIGFLRRNLSTCPHDVKESAYKGLPDTYSQNRVPTDDFCCREDKTRIRIQCSVVYNISFHYLKLSSYFEPVKSYNSHVWSRRLSGRK